MYARKKERHRVKGFEYVQDCYLKIAGFPMFMIQVLKGNFGQKRKNYHRCVTYRTVAGKNFRSQNLKEKSAGPFHPLLSSFFVLTFLLTFLNLCTQLLNLSTHFTKPEYE